MSVLHLGSPTTSSTSPGRRREPANVTIGVGILMLAEAVSLAVAAALHLSGLVHGRSPSFDPDAAGVAEAAIGVVLAVAAALMFRMPARARAIGIAANGFALFGFLIGLVETARGGHTLDIAYHCALIPLLTASLILLIRTRGLASRAG